MIPYTIQIRTIHDITKNIPPCMYDHTRAKYFHANHIPNHTKVA